MAGNNAFSLQGATVTNPLNPFGSTSLTTPATTPAQSALNKAVVPPPIAAPTQNIASHTTANPDGSSVTVKYQNTTPKAAPSASTGASSGLINSTPAPQPQNASVAPAPAPQPPAPPTFPGLIGSAATAAGALTKQGADNTGADYTNLQNTIKKIADAQTQEGNMQANMQGNPIPLEFQQGRGNIQQANFNSGLNALQNEATREAQVYQTDIGAQTSGIAGTQNAANAIAPSGNFPFVFNPATGGFTTPGSGANGNPQTTGSPSLSYNPAQDSQTLAQAVMKHQISYNDAVTALSYGSNGSAAPGQLSSAILAAGGNPTNLQAQAAATVSNIGTTATASTNAANAGYADAIKERANADASYGALTGISNQLTSTLGKWTNSGTLTDYNKAINTIASHLSSGDYQSFLVALGNTQASYQAILGSAGVTPTKADNDALNALNPNSSAQTIVSALNQLSKDAHALVVEPAYSKVNEYSTQLGI